MRKALNKLAALLHDGKVGGKVGVEHIVEAQLAQRRRHALRRCKRAVQPKLLRPCRTHGGRDLHHRHNARIVDRVIDPARIIALAQRRRWAVGDALAAVSAFRILNAAVIRRIHHHARTGAEQIPYLHRLHLVAHLDAAQALHAFVVFADERRGVVHSLAPQLFGKMRPAHIKVGRKRLERAVAAARTVGAGGIMVREDQPQIHAARLARLGAVGENDHTVRHHIVAGGNQAFHALHLHAAEAAGCDLVEILQVAQRGDMDIEPARRFEDRGILRHSNAFMIDGQRNILYHFPFLPPRNTP